MKYNLYIICILLLISCSSKEKQSTLPTIDVTKTYPKKEIALQDIANVEYIPLETKDDVLLDDFTCLCRVSSDTIIIGNYSEGDIFIFNGKGKVINHFNRKGSSGQEYREVCEILFDKLAQEIYILDAYFNYRIQVYDCKGKYKRTLAINKNYSFGSAEILNYDKERLLAYDKVKDVFAHEDTLKSNTTPFVFISKKNGTVIGHLPLKLKKRVKSSVKTMILGHRALLSAEFYSIVDNKKNWIISEVSKDTVFTYSKQNNKLTPIVVRQPEIQQMDKPLSFFQIEKITPCYFYGKIIKQKQPKKNSYKGFQITKICIDRKTNKIYEYDIVNRDMPQSKRFFEWLKPNHYSMLLKTDDLIELLEDGKLNGKLKTIAEKLKEDDNPVLMKVTFK